MEIGSEFDSSKLFLDKAQNTGFNTNAAYFATGRAAIFAAIQDIKRTRTVKKAYLPDYCCFSMVEPFLKSGIQVFYYRVEFSNGGVEYKIDYEKDFDVFLSMSYFGFEASNQDSIVSRIKQKGAAVIEDITHRLLTDRRSDADYFVASIRKWVGVYSGGMLIKANGTALSGKIPLSQEFLRLKESAMNKKLQFLNSSKKQDAKKAEFLDEFARANKMLRTDWEDRAIDSISLELINRMDKTAIAQRRRENANILYTARCKNMQFMFGLENGDVPLFVPVIFNTFAEREAVRKMLCQTQIYCPVHWPNEIDSKNTIFNKCLSLVVDQRYSQSDMQRIVEALEKGVQ